MRTPREPVDTGACIDDYCAAYRALVPDVRSFEQFKRLHLGVIAELPMRIKLKGSGGSCGIIRM